MDDRGSTLGYAAVARDVYTKLGPSELRILLLAPGKRGSSIECEMRVVPSPTTAQYEALSYVWGDTTQSRSIHCNGLRFRVTESLYNALDHLRYPDTWRRIWVDQLSINQVDQDELMNQVGQMGAIYSSATRVIVWLGTCDNKMALAWELLEETTLSSSLARSDFLQSSSAPSTPSKSPRRIPNRSCVSKYLNRASSSRESLASSTSSLSSLNGHTPIRPKNKRHDTPPSLKYALSIFQHAWFRRKWTFQEIVLANAAIICCGRLEMAWADLTAWYFHYASKLRSSSLLYDSDGFFENIISIRSQLNKDLKLSTLLMLTRPRLSTKAEDAIYAILGLLPDLTAHLETISRSSGFPDSSASQEKILFELYLSAFQYCLDQENDLAVLSAAGMYKGNHRADGWPSWLPDWRQQLPLRPLVLTEPTVLGPEAAFDDETFGCSPSSPLIETVDTPVYKLNLLPFPNASPPHSSLFVQGIRLGCVATRPGSWPSTYLIADTIAQKQLESRQLNLGKQFSQSVASLTTNSPKLVKMLHRSKSQGYANELGQTYLDSEVQCESIRTSASVEAGDWLCAFRGGRVLFAVRPLHDEDLEDQKNVMEVETHFVDNGIDPTGPQPMDSMKSVQTPLRGQFIGECAVHGLYPSDLFEAFNAVGGPLLEFELV